MISHSGEVFGFTSENIVLPRDKIAVTVLTDQEASGAAGAIANKVTGLLLSPLAGKTSESIEQAWQIFLGLQEGKIDRALFICNCNAYFDEQALGAYASILKALGPLQEFFRVVKEWRDDITFRVYDVGFPTIHLHVITYQMPGGKIEQFVVAPGE